MKEEIIKPNIITPEALELINMKLSVGCILGNTPYLDFFREV